MFLKSAKSTTSVFQTSKIGEQLSRKRGLESLAVKSAKESVFEDLALLLESSAICTDSQMDIVYSVHYANTNGLSQLENYLVAHAVSEYLSTALLFCSRDEAPTNRRSTTKPAFLSHPVGNILPRRSRTRLRHFPLRSPLNPAMLSFSFARTTKRPQRVSFHHDHSFHFRLHRTRHSDVSA